MKFRKKKKEVEYRTDLSIYGIFHIKAIEAASVTIDGTDPEFIKVSVSTVTTLYTIKIRTDDKKYDYKKREQKLNEIETEEFLKGEI